MEFNGIDKGRMVVLLFNLQHLDRRIRLDVFDRVHPKPHPRYSVEESKKGFTNENHSM